MFRPADGTETAGAYKVAIESRKRPSVLALSRQKLRNTKGTSHEGVAHGGYIVRETKPGTKPDVILLGTGSELNLAEDAAVVLEKEGISVRLVSMVCTDLYDEQTPAYKESVLPTAVTARVSVEAGTTFGWDRYVGTKGKAIGVDSFGASAPAPALYKHFGITLEAVVGEHTYSLVDSVAGAGWVCAASLASRPGSFFVPPGRSPPSPACFAPLSFPRLTQPRPRP